MKNSTSTQKHCNAKHYNAKHSLVLAFTALALCTFALLAPTSAQAEKAGNFPYGGFRQRRRQSAFPAALRTDQRHLYKD